ncbi:MAG: DUF389 domain-containing protein [Dehalococcoidia bacterium]|uniref:DUF389 domain-containing protein n=1 Tax=Candidatus Amarobacter glycogenicus TaxID=3140699 RepID=UPI001D50D666|nr:DUF389 domain-containing protein [Dehalococcoidia bacterium]MBK7726237.1 DUF389 domain-containing protein [Dehalococcoidia bacterium]MBK9343060.1 DUF389 domain-containing protein [Dehalococcoidia bacterium]MBK9546235.1 DUF389 domain-containing protein [Dehalococcoidia bacterium]MBK9612321.1 DUF389 domain-containing protein [Dehalococcoidia bacterium]
MARRPQTSDGSVRAGIARAGRADLRFRLLIVFSCVIATLGLLADSTAVVIGAMLVAPLLGPIMALGIALLGGRGQSFVAPAFALIEGAAVAVLLSWMLTEVLSHSTLDVLTATPREVTARTRPNPLDLGIALAGGAIGAYALVRLKDSAALPGVAIATALMPPLCTVGIGLAARDRGIWGGAFLLFATNLLAIMFSCAIVFWSLGLRPRRSSLPALRLALGAVSVGVIGVALFGLSVRAVQESREARELRSTVASALADVIPGSELVDIERSSAPEGGLEVRVTARTPGQSTLVEATAIQALVAQGMQTRISLVLVSVPVIVLDPLNPPRKDATVAVATPARATPVAPTVAPTTRPTVTPSPAPTATLSPTAVAPPVGNSP